MIATNLPKSSKLYKLLKRCGDHHHIHLFECNDGAMIMECIECPYHHVLTFQEEDIVREEIENQHLGQ